jgi:Asp/Glu/hydantoin racemase
MIITGGYSYQGYSVGILMFDQKFYPKMTGDVGNATSYPFPVLLREISDLIDNPYPPLTNEDGTYTDIVQQCIDAVVQMEKDGVRCIAMCCGFFSLIQPVLAEQVNIPIMTSPLMMIPVIHQMIKPDQSIVVVTAAAKLLSNEFFTQVGADLNNRVTLAGLDDSKVFSSMCMGGTAMSFEYDDLRDDVLNAIENARKVDPKVGAVLLECTTLPPFANEVREATLLPVFDFIACVEWMHRAVVPKQYIGYI